MKQQRFLKFEKEIGRKSKDVWIRRILLAEEERAIAAMEGSELKPLIDFTAILPIGRPIMEVAVQRTQRNNGIKEPSR